MSQNLRFRDFRFAVVCLGWTCGLGSGCAGEGAAFDTAAQEPLGRNRQALIGGAPAAPDELRSTVGIGDTCSAAKVGSRLFLTAAHCVAVARPGRGVPVPDDFPPNEGISADYLPGQSLLMHWGLNADDEQQGQFTIVQTSIHPSWWGCPLCQDPILGTDGAADIAVIEIAEDTPAVPEAQVSLDPVEVGAQLVKVGWGCEERTNIDAQELELGRYKTAPAESIAASEIQPDSPITDQQVVMVDASYVITAGHAQDESNASLCLGDSGGPLLLANQVETHIVGVNADYTFRPSDDPNDLGGVSWTDWHTRTSLGSLHGVGLWLLEQGVNTVGGGTPSSECTCPQGCDSVQPASVPFMHQGQVNRCYFFEELGYGVNSHSMLHVDLNGQNITNQWLGFWSYPAERDGGYYLYLRGDRPWSWAQGIE